MISIFTPTHDSRYLLEAYESLKEQTITNWEWVVLYNNGAIPLGIQDVRVKETVLDASTDKIGALKAAACRRATGDILLELDHDDLLMPAALEEVEKAFKASEVGFVYSNTIPITMSWKPGGRYSEDYGWKYRTIEYKGHTLDEHISFEPTPEAISKIWFAPNHLRAFRKTVYDKIGGHNTNMRVADDADLVNRLYLQTKFKHIDKGLYIYRVHGANTCMQPEHCKEIQNFVWSAYDSNILDMACKWSTDKGLRKIELGGRMAAYKGLETVDLLDADIVTDLNERWPFDNNSVGVVRANDVLEHLRDSIHTMRELSRVLAPGGMAFIQVPSTDGRGAFQDPTHVSFWNQNSFYYYTHAAFAKYIGTPVRFQTMRLYTTEKTNDQVCWVRAHLINLKDGYRPPGIIEI